MERIKFAIIALILAASTCRSEILIANSTPDKSTARLVDDLVNIVTSCYKGKVNGVGLAGNLPDTLSRTLSVQHSILVALIGNIRDFSDGPRVVDYQFRQKLNVFMIEASSSRQLNRLIHMNIKYSIWWNHMASFFILDLSPGCVNAVDYLLMAWRKDLLSASVICGHHKSGKLVFTYNPYTSQAPAPWQLVTVLSRNGRHPFAVFSRKYRANETVCADLDFDKTKDLGGFIIRAQGRTTDTTRPVESKTTKNVRKRGRYVFDTRRLRIFGTLCRIMNATQRFVDSSNVNIIPFPGWMQNSWSIDLAMTTYPHEQTEVSIITQFRGHKSQLNKILSVIDIDSWYGMGVVYVITLIFLKIFAHQALVPGLLNLIRITCNMGFTNLPNNNSARIYLGTLLFFVVTMQGIFQGDLAALLTKYISLRNVDTMQDLANLGYKAIYGKSTSRYWLEDTDLEKIFIVVGNQKDCITHVKNNSMAACIEFVEGTTFDRVQEFNLHVSRKPLERIYSVFATERDWPVYDRVNRIIARMVEADVLDEWDVQCDPIQLSDFYVDALVKSNVDFKNIELQEVAFAFVILGIGLACAIIVFLIELAMGYRCRCGIKMWCKAERVAEHDSLEERVVERLPA